jgi:bacillithiol biosynthesis cysteine-adding enzyme BshC
MNRQYQGIECKPAVQNNIDSLLDKHTFTVTTGHQLCLLTGPLYFISKIASAVKLADELKSANPNFNFVPVFWMASEDHDFAEISTTHFRESEVNWPQKQQGAVGRMSTEGISALIEQVKELSGLSKWTSLLAEAYAKNTLAEATRFLVNALFGEYGVVVLDGDDKQLKAAFRPVILEECLERTSFKEVSATNRQLQDLGYEPQVYPREINLFYLSEQSRERLVQKNSHEWSVLNGHRTWDEKSLREEVDLHPENFSPNVVLRPLYQELILPNLAYVGGPGELAYWLQLKWVFEKYDVAFPMIVLRDHACILPKSVEDRVSRLNITLHDLFLNKKDLIQKVLPESSVDLSNEKEQLKVIFETLASRAGAIDPTLSAAVLAEGKRQESSIDQIGGKMIRAIKQKEEIKLRQLEKLISEVFPHGEFLERRTNFFQFAAETDEDIIAHMVQAFKPMENKLTILLPSPAGSVEK